MSDIDDAVSSCYWVALSGIYETDCGMLVRISDFPVSIFKYCPFCGRKLVYGTAKTIYEKGQVVES